MNKIIISLLIFNFIYAQKCLNNNGVAVDWWVVFKPPGSLGAVHGYLDPSTKTQITILNTSPDYPETALYRTLNQINTLSVQVLAWND
jgi:hypothetical protein